MENAVEALKTAVAVLVFVIAITVTFTMFSKARATTDAIVTMQDKQKYLETAAVDNGILYTSSDAIEGGALAETMTTNGDRIVTADDVISTIYRYNIEKYGVTILKNDGTVLARFDSNTENIMRQWYNITDAAAKSNYADRIKQNLNNSYITGDIDLDASKLHDLYYIDVDGNGAIHAGAPWYGNQKEIVKRCNADISGDTYALNKQTYYGKDLFSVLSTATRIIEVVNEIDQSKYLIENPGTPNEIQTNLLQEYQLPTIEIIYIIE